MTPKPQANTLDEIERLTGIVGIKLPKTANKLEKLIQALITEARIDELENIRGRVEYIHSDSVSDRLEQLRS